MKKRGQINNVFVFIFALVVAAFIIGFGYYVITKLMNLEKEVETIKFKSDFEKQINWYYDFAPGTNANVKITVPNGIKAVCFVEDSRINGIIYKDVADIAKILTDKNVFFSTSEKDLDAKPIYIDKFKPNINPLCINTLTGILDIDLLTTGRYVEVSAHV